MSQHNLGADIQHVAPHRQHEYAQENDMRVSVGDFDYQEIDRHLGLAEPEPCAIRGWSDKKLEHASEALHDIAAWIANSRELSSAGLRAIAVSYVLRPDLFGDEIQSREHLGRRFGVTRQAIGKMVSQLWRLAGSRFYHGGILHGQAAREQRRKITAAYHARVGHKPRGAKGLQR